MAVITGRFLTGSAEVINGTADDDVIFPLGGWDTVNGGGGIDTLVINDKRANFSISGDANSSHVDAISGASSMKDLTTVNSIERVAFNDGMSVALDMGISQSGGRAALLVGAVLGQAALADKKQLLGSVIALFDGGLSLKELSGAVMLSSFTVLLMLLVSFDVSKEPSPALNKTLAKAGALLLLFSLLWCAGAVFLPW